MSEVAKDIRHHVKTEEAEQSDKPIEISEKLRTIQKLPLKIAASPDGLRAELFKEQAET